MRTTCSFLVRKTSEIQFEPPFCFSPLAGYELIYLSSGETFFIYWFTDFLILEKKTGR